MEKIENLLKEYKTLMGGDTFEGCNLDDLENAEKLLHVKLPEDFKKISLAYTIDYIGGIPNYQIARGASTLNIVDETLRIRKAIGLPHEFVFLSELDSSVILLNTVSIPAVIWVDSVAIGRLDSLEQTEYDSWDTYHDYFEFLIQTEKDDVS